MDAKKFLQLVEEKKKKILAKKEAPLKWEQKLEAAAKAKADAEAKARKAKAAKRKRRSVSVSDTDSSSDDGYEEGRKRTKKSHKKHKRHNHSDSDHEKRKDKKSRRKTKKRSSDSDYDSSDSDSDLEEERRKHGHKRHHKRSDSSSSDDEDVAERKKHRSKNHRRHRRSHSHDASDSDGSRHRRSIYLWGGHHVTVTWKRREGSMATGNTIGDQTQALLIHQVMKVRQKGRSIAISTTDITDDPITMMLQILMGTGAEGVCLWGGHLMKMTKIPITRVTRKRTEGSMAIRNTVGDQARALLIYQVMMVRQKGRRIASRITNNDPIALMILILMGIDKGGAGLWGGHLMKMTKITISRMCPRFLLITMINR